MLRLIIPSILLFLQVVAIIFILYPTGRPVDGPVTTIMIHILAVFSLIVLILSYFLFFKVESKCYLWIIPIAIAMLNIIVVIIMQILMAIGKL